VNAEFVEKIRQRSLRDLILAARMGWILYPVGVLLAYFSGLSRFSPKLFLAFLTSFSVLLVLRFLNYRKTETEPVHYKLFVAWSVTGAFLWGVVAAYGVAHAGELPYYTILLFGSLAIIGMGGLIMYVPVFAFFLAYLGSYYSAFSFVLLVTQGHSAWPFLLGNLAVLALLVWIGHRLHMAHALALVSSLLLERRARELESAYQKLEKTNAHRIQFMQTLSSELHASLDGINRVSEFLKQTPLGDEQLRLVETARRTTRDLVQYLEGVS